MATKTKLSKSELNIMWNLWHKVNKMIDKFDENDLAFPDGRSTLVNQLDAIQSHISYIISELS